MLSVFFFFFFFCFSFIHRFDHSITTDAHSQISNERKKNTKKKKNSNSKKVNKIVVTPPINRLKIVQKQSSKNRKKIGNATKYSHFN